jgi:radical SAM protein with 4Fe4S-binding SPASM domain
LIAYADELGVPVALSPSVTPMLTPEAIQRIADSPVKAVSISLDGSCAETHEGVRGVPEHFPATVDAIHRLVQAGVTVQVNTTVMRSNVEELADTAALLAEHGVHIWEVFFLVHVGRGVAEGAITPEEHEEVCHFLFDASQHGFIVRTVEAPFFRRIVAARKAGAPAPGGGLYARLAGRLDELLGAPTRQPKAHTVSTRDGKGIVFIAYDGEVYPAGFLPLPLGNVRDHPLSEIYRDNELLRDIRAAKFTGRCGRCEFADVCGGSRARAFAASGDPLGEDPACAYEPRSVTAVS